jgi:outer membrane protein OmpA-like peptidoglycan-associated protein
VNSSAIGPGYLLYPGGKYGRSVRALLQPGEKPGAVIHLHMPTHHRRAVAADDTKPATAASLPAAAPAATPPRSRHARPETPVTTDTASLPEDSAARLVGANTVGAAVPAKPPARAPRVTSATTAAPPTANTGATTVPFSFGGASVAPTTRTASATPPPRTTPSAAVATGLRKQSVISFAAGTSNLAAADVNAIHTLAASLNSAVANSAAHIQLYAYGGARGDKSSDSRRLSLKRGLVVRELLIEDGIPSEKIDVHAMGGADDNGVSDRVDVFVRG